MKFIAKVKVMPLKNILDPQGKAVQTGLKSTGYNNVEHVRVGKNIELIIETESAEKAKIQAEEMSKSLLANLIMEEFEVEIQEIK
jgi:phosphoribosylformylglycinamidine synthase